MLNAFSIDLEDWFCVYNFSRIIDRKSWALCENRIVGNTVRLLDILDRHDTRATFFVLGWIAEQYPDLIKEIDHRGHEIASHGYQHQLLWEMTPDEFRTNLSRCLEALSRCVSQQVQGFRAPSFSLGKNSWWALDVLKELDFSYDSSIFPVRFHPDYGNVESRLTPFEISPGLLEIPLSCVLVLGRRIPVGGGGYFRLYPYPIFKWLLQKCHSADQAVVFYLHPWEIDPDQPRVPSPVLKRMRHYVNIGQTEKRLHRLLEDFNFSSFEEVFAVRP